MAPRLQRSLRRLSLSGKKEPEPRATRSFKVKANLGVNHRRTNLTEQDDDDNNSLGCISKDDILSLGCIGKDDIHPPQQQRQQQQTINPFKNHKKERVPRRQTSSYSGTGTCSSRSSPSTSSSRNNSPLPPPEEAAATTTTATAATTARAANTTTTTTTPLVDETPAVGVPAYYRGGGYCSHVHRTYNERWSDDHVEQVIRSWKMTDGQRAKLLDLKERLRDLDHAILNDPNQLVYFLKDELGDVELAERFVRKTAASRSSASVARSLYGDSGGPGSTIDTILTDGGLPDDYDYFPMTVILEGVDREGDPIDVTRTGAADCWGLYKRHGREAMIRHAIYYQELGCRGAWVDDYEAAHRKRVTQYTVIFDLQGLSSRHMRPGLLPVCGTIARVLQDTYPELVKRVLVIRAPAIFKMIWGLVKHFFDPELRDLMIFATNDANSQELMEQYIDVDVLPHCLHPGGKDGPVARGYEHIIMEGGMIPPEGEYRTPDHVKDLAKTAAATTTTTVRRNPNKKELLSRSVSELSDTQVTSNTRKKNHRRTPVARPIKSKCTKLMSGSFDVINPLSGVTKSQCMVMAPEYSAVIQIDK